MCCPPSHPLAQCVTDLVANDMSQQSKRVKECETWRVMVMPFRCYFLLVSRQRSRNIALSYVATFSCGMVTAQQEDVNLPVDEAVVTLQTC